MLIWIFCGLAVLAALYVLVGRATFKSWFPGFYEAIEPVEIVLWKKSETILFARLKIISGLLLMVLAQLGTLDLTPLMPLVPDQYEPALKAAWNLIPLALTVMGWMDEQLRKKTTKPIEIAQLPDAVAATLPAVEIAEVAKQEAVAIVAEAKAMGAV